MRIGLPEMIYCTVLVSVILMLDKLFLLLEAMKGIKPGSSPEEKIWGIIAFGMWAVTMFALISLAQRSKRDNGSEKD